MLLALLRRSQASDYLLGSRAVFFTEGNILTFRKIKQLKEGDTRLRF